MVAVELLIFMCVNKLLVGMSDPAGMIYPTGYGSGENFPPMTGMGILTVPNFYGGDRSKVAIPNGDLPIATLTLVCQGVEVCMLCHINSVKVLPRGNKARDRLGKGASQTKVVTGVRGPLHNAQER